MLVGTEDHIFHMCKKLVDFIYLAIDTNVIKNRFFLNSVCLVNSTDRIFQTIRCTKVLELKFREKY
jgi:hypothetical protein